MSSLQQAVRRPPAPSAQRRRRPVVTAIAGVLILLIIIGVVQKGVAPTLQTVLDGLELGLVLALIGVGLSLIFATTGIFNFAQGEFATLGAAVCLWLNVAFGLPVIIAGLLAVIAGAAGGLASEQFLWRPLRARKVSTISALVVAIGLGLALRNLFLALMGGGSKSYTQYAVQGSLSAFGVSITPKSLAAIVMSLAAIGLLALFLKRTRTGQAVRAVADDKTLASASGIAANTQLSIVWALGGSLAALGGVLLGLSEQVRSDMGNQVLLLAIAGVILGGLGTVFGVVVGSIIVGVVTQASTLWLPPELKYVTALAVLIVILLVRPQGLFGRRDRVG